MSDDMNSEIVWIDNDSKNDSEIALNKTNEKTEDWWDSNH